MAENPEAGNGICWHDPTGAPFRLAGFAWYEQDRVYRRLPVAPKWPLPPSVDHLSNQTSGGQIQFQTDSPRLMVRATLAAAASMCHMPPTGQCGFDCYIGPPKQQRFCSVTKYDRASSSYELELFSFDEAERRNVTLNFPLYQGVKEVAVGLAEGASVTEPPPYDDDRPVVVYGTSITQGGCAARPGMAYTNILSRWLNRPFVNVGFSGSGRGEPEVARTIAEIGSPACFVLDYEANASAEQRLETTLRGFIEILRDAHAQTPILVVSRIRYAAENLRERATEERIVRRDFQRDTVNSFREAGDDRVLFFDGGDLLGDEFHECTVDGSHPTDLGFWRMAKGLAPALAEALALG